MTKHAATTPLLLILVAATAISATPEQAVDENAAHPVVDEWTMETADDIRPDCPKGWQYDGPLPYLASWAKGIAAAGERALTIADDDPRSHGLWCTRRMALADGRKDLDLSFALKVEKLTGTWQVSMNYYSSPVVHNYARLAHRVDALFSVVDEHLLIKWVMHDEESMTELGQDKLPLAKADKSGFLLVRRRIPIPKGTQSYRISLLSGWDPKNTGTVWLDNVTVGYRQK